ncbi:Uncharacterised protein [Mycobacteroides abscessus subsp. massiliense]|nr:Uncharacterised protein [Mycobacteroides abscessus subsp. massiliense]SKY72339.1 Uncharacterised protein [Mycobacteroides abscessus subsp. massiliense]
MSDQRNRLTSALHDAFWAAFKEWDEPFGYFDPSINLIDGELPPGIFGKLADAAIAALCTADPVETRDN